MPARRRTKGPIAWTSAALAGGHGAENFQNLDVRERQERKRKTVDFLQIHARDCLCVQVGEYVNIHLDPLQTHGFRPLKSPVQTNAASR
ncbi:hypothetical protein B0T14DRAFT_77836 [Immersiella caudata]|uniref:Uncharacterized protein n=1 Tax=Immersiella caudata TaxID=314043 RepID=A0AA40CD02_9PEZI|nr:hypothetical protein B0T14DRAFT_77836 [Immersiella caudata]